RTHLAPDAPADRARQLARARRAGRPLHHRHVVEDRADAALARRAHLRRQGRRVRAFHGPAVPYPGDARGGARGRGAARAHGGRRLAAPRRPRRVGDHGRLPRLPPRLARRVLDREERVRGTPQRLVLDPHGGLPGVREAGGGAGDRLVRPRAARGGAPRLHHRRGGGRRAGGHPRRLRPRLPARARGRRGALPRRGRVRAPARRHGALIRWPASFSPATSCATRSAATPGRRRTIFWASARSATRRGSTRTPGTTRRPTTRGRTSSARRTVTASPRRRISSHGSASVSAGSSSIPCTARSTGRVRGARRRDLVFRGATFAWRKRTEWMRCLDLPARTGAAFEVAMDVGSVAGDAERLMAHGWRVVDPLAVSADPWRYRDYLRGSRGEFTVAKD